MDMWASLPSDLLVVIFLGLDPAAVICCAGVCKPWRRAIIGNAWILGPHLDRFGPSLLLGVFHNCRDAAYLRRKPGPFLSALPWNDGGDTETIAAHSLIPASSTNTSVDRSLYKELLWSRDGFILLMARSGRDRNLCLCNPITGDCTFVPSAASCGRYSTYFLLTSYDDLSPSGMVNNVVARVLAVHTRTRYCDDVESAVFKLTEQVMSYQTFSTSGDNAGKWGPVKRSVGEVEEGLTLWMERMTTVVCGDAVYWAAGPGGYITCVLALDMRIGRTWITELPKQCHFDVEDHGQAILGTSSDGRLSFMQSNLTWDPTIQVWVLTGDAMWTLKQSIPIGRESLNAGGHIPYLSWFNAFCPRSQCMVVLSQSNEDKELLIDLGSGSSYPPVMCIGNFDGYHCCPYEIDCSTTYISKMKHF